MLPDGPRVCGGEHRLRDQRKGWDMSGVWENFNYRCYDYFSNNKTWMDAGFRLLDQKGASRCGAAQNIVFNSDEMVMMHCADVYWVVNFLAGSAKTFLDPT